MEAAGSCESIAREGGQNSQTGIRGYSNTSKYQTEELDGSWVKVGRKDRESPPFGAIHSTQLAASLFQLAPEWPKGQLTTPCQRTSRYLFLSLERWSRKQLFVQVLAVKIYRDSFHLDVSNPSRIADPPCSRQQVLTKRPNQQETHTCAHTHTCHIHTTCIYIYTLNIASMHVYIYIYTYK